MQHLIKVSEGTAARRRLLVYLVDDTDGKTAETGVTIAAGDVKISKNGAAEGNHAGTLTELASGRYYYEFTSGEVDTVGFVSFALVKTGIRAFVTAAQVVSFDPYDSVRAGLTALPNAAAEAAGGLYTRGTGAGQINQDANGRIDSHPVALAADVITAASIAAGAIGSSEAPNLDVAISTRLAPTTAGRTLDVTATGEAGVDLDNTIGTLAKGVELTGFNDLDAAGVRGAVGLAAANLDTQLAGKAVPGDAMALTVAERAATADKLLGRTRAGGADGGRTVAECLAFGRNKWAIAGGVLTVYQDDDLTPLFTAAVTTGAGDPVQSVDPV